MQPNEIENYIFGTLRKQDTALRGIVRDLKMVKNTTNTTKALVVSCCASLVLFGVEVNYLKTKNDILEKEVDAIKSRLVMLSAEKREEVN